MPEWTRWLRKLLIGIALVVAVIIVVVLAMPLVMPTDFIGNQIAALVRQKTGRDLHIAGPISFSLLPRLALVAQDVRLTSPAGHFAEDFMIVKSVELVLKPLPLLHGAIEIEQLRLSQPVIDFEVDADGRRNWIFHPVVASPATTVSAVKGNAGATFAVDDVSITDGAASYRDDRKAGKQSLSDLNLTLSVPNFSGPLTAAGTAVYNGEPVNFALSVASPETLHQGGSSTATMDIAAQRGSLSFGGEIKGGHGSQATGMTKFKTPSLRNLLAWAPIGLGPQDSELGPLSVDGRIDFRDSKLTLTDASIVLDTVAAKGTLIATRDDGRFELDVNDLALNGGKGTGKIVIDSDGSQPDVAATGNLTGITLSRLSFDIAGFDTLSGTGDVSFDFKGTGKTLRELVASLNGTARVSFANGTVGSTGLSPLMQKALGPAINDKTIPREIEYQTLSATATIDNGILHNNDLKLSGPQMSATGTGSLDLAPHRINYLWQPNITDLGSARIAITGNWSTPTYRVESVTITRTKGLNIPGLKPP